MVWLGKYCKTLNFSVPCISRISRAKQNCELKGREYQLRAKIGRNYYSISNCMVLIRQNKGAKIIMHAKSPTFRAAKLKGFKVTSKETVWIGEWRTRSYTDCRQSREVHIVCRGRCRAVPPQWYVRRELHGAMLPTTSTHISTFCQHWFKQMSPSLCYYATTVRTQTKLSDRTFSVFYHRSGSQTHTQNSADSSKHTCSNRHC